MRTAGWRIFRNFKTHFQKRAKAPKDIPAEVWDGVRNGLSLTASYARWQVEQARAEAERYQHAAGSRAEKPKERGALHRKHEIRR